MITRKKNCLKNAKYILTKIEYLYVGMLSIYLHLKMFTLKIYHYKSNTFRFYLNFYIASSSVRSNKFNSFGRL